MCQISKLCERNGPNRIADEMTEKVKYYLELFLLNKASAK